MVIYKKDISTVVGRDKAYPSSPVHLAPGQSAPSLFLLSIADARTRKTAVLMILLTPSALLLYIKDTMIYGMCAISFRRQVVNDVTCQQCKMVESLWSNVVCTDPL